MSFISYPICTYLSGPNNFLSHVLATNYEDPNRDTFLINSTTDSLVVARISVVKQMTYHLALVLFQDIWTKPTFI